MKQTIYTEQMLVNVFSELKMDIRAGKKIKLTTSIVKNMKTKTQLGFIFGGIVEQLQKHFIEAGYDFSKDKIKNILYIKTGVKTRQYCPILEDMEYVGRTLSEMSSEECHDFIENVFYWCDNTIPECVFTPDLRYCWTKRITEDDIRLVQQASSGWGGYQPEYMSAVRKQACLCCGAVSIQSEVHHLRNTNDSGVSMKAPDYLTIPLCPKHHRQLHDEGELSFYKPIEGMLGLNMYDFCLLNFSRFINKR